MFTDLERDVSAGGVVLFALVAIPGGSTFSVG